MNIKTQIAIELPEGGIITLPVDLTITDSDFSVGAGDAPLHDAAILPD